MKSYPGAPGAAAVVLDWVQRQDDVDSDSTQYVRIKILTEEGKKYGDIEIPYVPLIANVTKLQARTTKPDGTIVPYTGKPFEKLIVKAGGVRVVSKTFSLPDVQPGSIIEYRYNIGYRDNMLRDTRFTVQRELPVRRQMLWLRPYKEAFTSFFSYRGLPQGKKPIDTGKHYELLLEDVPAYVEEPYSPPDEELKPMVNFFYLADKITGEAFWMKEGKDWTTAVEDFIGNRGGIRKAAQEITVGADTATAKLEKIYARVQQIRNLAYEEEKTDAESRKLRDNNNVEDVLRNGYGYSGQINRLFVALARAAGFDAKVVVVSERDDHFFQKNLPVASQLDGEVSVVVVDGKEVMFDAGTPYAPFGMLAWQKSGVPGMKLARKTDPVWLVTPDVAADNAVLHRRADLQIEDEAVKGSVTLTYRGQEALVMRLTYFNDDDASVRKSLEESGKKMFPDGSTVTLKNVTGMKSSTEPVVVTYDVVMPHLASDAGTRVLVPLSVFETAAKNPFAAEARKYPVYFNHPFQTQDEVVIKIPERHSVESTPQSINHDLSALKYQSSYQAGLDKTIRYTRRLYIGNSLFKLDQYKTLRGFYGKVATSDQEQLVLRKAAK